MSSTTYNVLVNGEQVDSKSKKDRAIAIADGLRAENPEAQIDVATPNGTVVHTVKVKGTHAKPWTRSETHDGIEVEVPRGYVVAYTRKRVGAVVARSEAKDGWLVLTEDGQSFEATNTVQAREITNSLAADHKTASEAAKLAEAEARAAAKVQRDADRAEAKRLKEAEKARKQAERDEAKAAKEAEKAEKAARAEAEKEAAPEGELASA